MQVKTTKTTIDNRSVFIQPNEILLDIETTGLSPEVSTVFMIGCSYYSEQTLHTIQWMADDLTLECEQDILQSFSGWIYARLNPQTSLSLITYNGQQFDLPFLKSRFDQCQISWPTIINTRSQYTDYYRIASGIRHLLPVSNLKLHTLASWLGYQQTKTPSGRSLIKAYHNYIKEKDPATLNLLFLHNQEDLEALAYVTSIQSYLLFFKGSYTVESMEFSKDLSNIFIHLNTTHVFPCQLTVEHNDFKIDLNSKNIRLSVPVYDQGLRFYYNDYKNYVYLLKEDYVLPKSMATYIDKSHWIRATADNCYTWFNPDTSFFSDLEKIKSYIRMIFTLFGFL